MKSLIINSSLLLNSFLICLLFEFTGIGFAHAQELMHQFQLEKNFSVINIQGYQLGDTLLINIDGALGKKKNKLFRSFVATNNELEMTETKIPELEGRNICGIIPLENHTKRIFHIEPQDNGFTIKAIDVNYAAGTTKQFDSGIQFKGLLMGLILNKTQLEVFWYRPDDNVLIETDLIDLVIMHEQEFALPFELSQIPAEEIAFFQRGSFTGTVQAMAP